MKVQLIRFYKIDPVLRYVGYVIVMLFIGGFALDLRPDDLQRPKLIMKRLLHCERQTKE